MQPLPAGRERYTHCPDIIDATLEKTFRFRPIEKQFFPRLFWNIFYSTENHEALFFKGFILFFCLFVRFFVVDDDGSRGFVLKIPIMAALSSSIGEITLLVPLHLSFGESCNHTRTHTRS